MWVSAYSFGPPMLDPWEHSLHWGLHSGDTQCKGLQSRATDFGFMGALIARGPTVWGPTMWDLESRATNFGTGAYSLRAYKVSVYNLGSPIGGRWEHLLHLGLQSGDLQCRNPQSPATDFRCRLAFACPKDKSRGPFNVTLLRTL